MYARLAIVEEREMRKQLGDEYAMYAENTPRFIPELGSANVNRSKAA